MTSNILFDALKSHFKAERDKATAVLTVYLQSPVGVGEHSDLMGEMIMLTQKIADAQGAIDTLEKTFEVKSDAINE